MLASTRDTLGRQQAAREKKRSVRLEAARSRPKVHGLPYLVCLVKAQKVYSSKAINGATRTRGRTALVPVSEPPSYLLGSVLL